MEVRETEGSVNARNSHKNGAFGENLNMHSAINILQHCKCNVKNTYIYTLH